MVSVIITDDKVTIIDDEVIITDDEGDPHHHW